VAATSLSAASDMEHFYGVEELQVEGTVVDVNHNYMDILLRKYYFKI
jgi:hypothetical protein